MASIPLTNRPGQYALVDDEDYSRVAGHSWRWNKGYAITNKVIDGKRKTIQLHRLIANYAAGVFVDHINLDKLDCRKANLRPANGYESARNVGKRKHGLTSCYKGVDWCKAANKWRSVIRVENRQLYLGCFSDEADAARAYDQAALIHHKDFARLNFPLDPAHSKAA